MGYSAGFQGLKRWNFNNPSYLSPKERPEFCRPTYTNESRNTVELSCSVWSNVIGEGGGERLYTTCDITVQHCFHHFCLPLPLSYEWLWFSCWKGGWICLQVNIWEEVQMVEQNVSGHRPMYSDIWYHER